MEGQEAYLTACGNGNNSDISTVEKGKIKEMIVYYYNPNLEKEFLQSFDPSK